jgi:hypothetical protein
MARQSKYADVKREITFQSAGGRQNITYTYFGKAKDITDALLLVYKYVLRQGFNSKPNGLKITGEGSRRQIEAQIKSGYKFLDVHGEAVEVENGTFNVEIETTEGGT